MFIDPVPYSQLLGLPGGKKLAHDGEKQRVMPGRSPPLVEFLDRHSACDTLLRYEWRS